MELNQLIKLELQKAFSKESNLSNNEIYRRIADKLKVHPERVRKHYRMMKEKEINPIPSFNDTYVIQNVRKVNNDLGTFESTTEANFEPKSDLELADLHRIDLSKYSIKSYWSKMKPDGKFSSSVLASLKKVDNDLELQKEILLEELFKEAPKVKNSYKAGNRKYAYEISLPDVHFGKFSWSEESGEDYDLKIAAERFSNAIEHFLSIVDLSTVDRFIFPVGNDLINIDSRKGETTAGTRVDSDTRFFKIVKAVKTILVETINKLSSIAPVDVVIVQGNHDYETMWMLGEMLEAYYHNTGGVSIDNAPRQRKYYQYGKNGFLYTHGNEEKHSDLGLIFATEQPDLWASCTATRMAKIGHFHKGKKLNFVSVDENTGFTLQILPSLSGTDFWHSSKGYMSKKAAKSFLYDKEQGLIAEYTYSI